MRKLLILALLLSSTALAESTSIVTTTTLPNGTVGTGYSAALTASPGCGGTFCNVWGIDGNQPPGISLWYLWDPPNSYAGATEFNSLTGTPAQAGTFTFTVYLNQKVVGTPPDQYTTWAYSKTFTITIVPAFLTLNGTVGNVGQAYSDFVYTTNTSASTCDLWSIAAGSLPPGLVLTASPTTSDKTPLQGTPTTAGTYPFTVRLTDSCLSQVHTQAFTITIGSNTAPVNVSASGLPSVVGAWGNVQATWRDSGGWATIVSHEIMVTHTNTAYPYANMCYIEMINSTQIYLYNASGTSWLAPVNMGTAAFLSNGLCTIDAANSSYTSKSGTDMTASIRIKFTAAFATAGVANLYLRSSDGQFYTGYDGPFQTKTILLSSGAKLIVTTYH